MYSPLHSIQQRTFGLLALALAIPAISSSIALGAQQKPAQEKQRAPTQSTPTTRNSPAIEIKVETFRKQIVPGTSMGVIADITNNSSAPVYLREQDVQLVLPTEVEEKKSAQDGWFPTEDYEKEPRVISLKPNETYRVFWNRTSGAATAQADGPSQPKSSAFSGAWRWIRWLQFIGFTPGAYPITVEAKYWDQRKFEGDEYHTAIEAKTVEFAAPQGIILLGAALGGLIFTFLGMVRAEQNAMNGLQAGRLKTLGKKGAVLVGSILLSVIITILLSRIAETQFFIKVSVSDFWGAIAVGFLANYGGWAALDKMVPGGGKRDEAK